jgi:hypothetical protein
MNKITAVAGENMRIKCPVAGYPINEIRWEKGAYTHYNSYVNTVIIT